MIDKFIPSINIEHITHCRSGTNVYTLECNKHKVIDLVAVEDNKKTQLIPAIIAHITNNKNLVRSMPDLRDNIAFLSGLLYINNILIDISQLSPFYKHTKDTKLLNN